MALANRPPGGGFFMRDWDWQPKALTPQYKTTVTRAPSRALVSMPQTLRETTGPVVGHNLIGPADNVLLGSDAEP
ncbi:MAG: protocatechuate 3,4-dioxygenase subunit beta, partial [Alphaproteobacteria bacterium]